MSPSTPAGMAVGWATLRQHTAPQGGCTNRMWFRTRHKMNKNGRLSSPKKASLWGGGRGFPCPAACIRHQRPVTSLLGPLDQWHWQCASGPGLLALGVLAPFSNLFTKRDDPGLVSMQRLDSAFSGSACKSTSREGRRGVSYYIERPPHLILAKGGEHSMLGS